MKGLPTVLCVWPAGLWRGRQAEGQQGEDGPSARTTALELRVKCKGKSATVHFHFNQQKTEVHFQTSSGDDILKAMTKNAQGTSLLLVVLLLFEDL